MLPVTSFTFLHNVKQTVFSRPNTVYIISRTYKNVYIAVFCRQPAWSVIIHIPEDMCLKDAWDGEVEIHQNVNSGSVKSDFIMYIPSKAEDYYLHFRQT